MKTVVIVFCLFISCIIISASAEQSESKRPQTKVEDKIAIDNIFNEIMQSLPENVKNKLDSLKSSPVDRKISVSDHSTNNRFNDQSRSDLSQDLRLKVEKAMKEIDLQQQKRQLQFKESKKKN